MKKLLSIVLVMGIGGTYRITGMNSAANNMYANLSAQSKYSHLMATIQGAFSGVTPENKEAIILDLIDAGVAVNAQSQSNPGPLYWAVCHGFSKKVIKALIAKGADVNAPGWAGNKPLDAALLQNNTRIARLLIAQGANKVISKPAEVFLFKPKMQQWVMKHCVDASNLVSYKDSFNKAKLLLLGMKDKNSSLYGLPEDILYRIMFYAPDCIMNKTVANKAIVASGSGEWDTKSTEVFFRLYNSISDEQRQECLHEIERVTSKSIQSDSHKAIYLYNYLVKRQFLKMYGISLSVPVKK